MFLVDLLKLLFAIFSVPGCGQHIERKCFNRDNPIGNYLGIDYQIVYVTEKHFLELECQACDEANSPDANVTWSLVDFNVTATYPSYRPLNPKSKKFKKHMAILENNALYIDKAKGKHSGFYNCNLTRTDDTDNSTILSSYNYLVQVNDKIYMSEVLTGTLTDWEKYRVAVIDLAASMLDEESLEEQVAELDVLWGNWSDCLCGSFRFDNRRFRYAYPYVIVNESGLYSLIFPTHSDWLREFYSLFANLVENVTIFYEYERCVEDCIPDALVEDVEYRYEQSVYLPEGSDIKFLCPDSENASEILWVLNEEKVLPKMAHSLGTGDEETHIAVDMLDELFLIQVRQSEAGIYSCIVDLEPIKKITVTIIPKSIFLSKDFLQCILAIAYVLIFCFIVCVFILLAKIYRIYYLYRK